MLQALRDKSSGWIATVILGLLVIPFAFFGMEQYLFQRNDTFVAKIEAPPKWWRRRLLVPVTMLWQREESARQFRTAFGRRASSSAPRRRAVRSARIRKRRQQAFRARQSDRPAGAADVAGRAGVAIGDAQVRAHPGDPGFQVDGKFDPQVQLALGCSSATDPSIRAAHSR